MSFFTRQQEQKKKAKQGTISHEAMQSYNGSGYSYMLNKDYILIRIAKDNSEEITREIKDVTKTDELMNQIKSFMSESLNDQSQSALNQFISNVCESMTNHLLANELKTKPLEDKYNLVLRGLQAYIPSSLLNQYEGSQEEKILLFLSERYSA